MGATAYGIKCEDYSEFGVGLSLGVSSGLRPTMMSGDLSDYLVLQCVAMLRRDLPTFAQAGWYMTAKLGLPDNITLLPLLPKAPELNPVENVWQFMRENWLSNRVFRSYDDILDHCCDAWNRLIDESWCMHHVPWPTSLGTSVLINGRWYKAQMVHLGRLPPVYPECSAGDPLDWFLGAQTQAGLTDIIHVNLGSGP